MRSICLITTGHISTDPRLIKEAVTLSKSGYLVHLIFTQYVAYQIDHDQHILDQNPEWTYQTLNWTGKSFISKFNRLKSKFVALFSSNTDLSLNRNLHWQRKKALAYKADLYIAHNLGTLPVAVYAANKNNAKCGFDAEDFHRNEVSDEAGNTDVKLKTALEEKYIPLVDYITAASPQIAAKYGLLFNRDVIPVLNLFPKTGVPTIVNNINDPLKLFWFSQTIGPNRGLETIIEAGSISNISLELHLLGNITSEYEVQLQELVRLKANKVKLVLHSPVYPEELFKIAPQFDIGLAAEPYSPLNRDICLTNKIFTYIQCGLAVTASATSAQKALIGQYPQTGRLYHNANELAQILIAYHQHRDVLYSTKIACYQAGQTALNWENEAEIFLSTINKVIAA